MRLVGGRHRSHYGHHGHRGSEIDIVTRGEYIRVSLEILSQYLPNFETYIRNYGTLARNGRLTIRSEDFPAFQDPTSRRALQCLFRYLHEIDAIRTSSALYDCLEKSWRQSIQGRGWHGRVSPTTKLFAKLGKILDPFHLDNSKPIFDAMSTFFADHCEEIILGGGDDWIEYLYALDRMNRDITHVLSLVSQKGRLTEGDLHRLMYPTRDLEHQLCPDTIKQMAALIGIRHDRAYHDHIHDRRGRRGGRLGGCHVAHCTDPGRTKTGAEVDADYLLYVHDYDPHRIIIKGRGRRNRQYPYDDMENPESMYSSEEEYIHTDDAYLDGFRDGFSECISSGEDDIELMHEFPRARMPLGHDRRAIERDFHEDDFEQLFPPRGRVVKRNLLAGVY